MLGPKQLIAAMILLAACLVMLVVSIANGFKALWVMQGLSGAFALIRDMQICLILMQSLALALCVWTGSRLFCEYLHKFEKPSTRKGS